LLGYSALSAITPVPLGFVYLKSVRKNVPLVASLLRNANHHLSGAQP
jgi:hypothetical protein